MATTVIAAFNEFMKDTVNLKRQIPMTHVQAATGLSARLMILKMTRFFR